MASMIGISRRTTVGSLFMGFSTADNPSTRAMLQILLPTTFPTAIMLLPFIEDTRLTTSSGAEVPKATTVKPMTIGVIPRLRARLEEPLTSHSAPKYSNTKPTRQYRIYRTIASFSFQIFAGIIEERSRSVKELS
jgi:hypothetical protein